MYARKPLIMGANSIQLVMAGFAQKLPTTDPPAAPAGKCLESTVPQQHMANTQCHMQTPGSQSTALSLYGQARAVSCSDETWDDFVGLRLIPYAARIA